MTDIQARITLRAMTQFIAVAEELHFRRAAKRLHMSQPPLTTAIRKLEADMGVTLIERGSRVLGLTAAGKTFLEEAQKTLRQAEQAIAATVDVAEGRSGLLRIGYVGSALYGRLPEVIRAYRTLYPSVRLELREATTAAQIAALREGELDIAVLIPPFDHADDIIHTPFDNDRLCMALPKHHPLVSRDVFSLSDLAQEPFILWPMLEGRGFHLQVIRLCAQAGFVPMVAQEAHGMHAVLSLVATGAGVAIVPESMHNFRHDKVNYYPLSDSKAAFTLALGYRNVSSAGQVFIDFAQDKRLDASQS